MLNSISDFLKGKTTLHIDASGNPTSEDILIATSIILLEMAGSDDDYAPEEVQTIFKVMQDQFNIQKGDVYNILNQAKELREESEKIDEFIAVINANFKAPQRQLILAMVWKVVFADGEVEKFEERFANQLQHRLQLTPDEAKRAKEMAKKGEI